MNDPLETTPAPPAVTTQPPQPPYLAPSKAQVAGMEKYLRAGCTEEEACHAVGIRKADWLTFVVTERPAGYVQELCAAVARKDAERKLYDARVADATQEVLDAQLSLARGQSFLFVQRKDEDGENVGRPEMITDPDAIADYLAGDLEPSRPQDDFYYITTKEPNPAAQKDMLDRVRGRAAERVDVTSKGERIHSYTAEELAKIDRMFGRDRGDEPPQP